MSGVITVRSYVNDVCKLGQMEKCCRFLGCSSQGLECLKHTEHHDYLTKRAEAKEMNARADNCGGWAETRGELCGQEQAQT